jgi:predicted transposase YdaD
MAIHELDRINADKTYRQLLETREKSELYVRTRIAESRQEGREEEKMDLVLKMLNKGKTPAEISDLTDIPVPEIMRIAKTASLSGSPIPPRDKVSETPKPFGKPRTKKKP